MASPQATDLEALFDAITSSIAAQFPDFATVRDHVETRARLATPACLIDMDSAEPVAADPGSGQIELAAVFEATVIIGFRGDRAKREIRRLAAALAHHVHEQRWGLPCNPAEVVALEPDAFDPDLDRYEMYRIEWRQGVFIGTSVWTNDGAIPTTVLASTAPDVGPDHEDDYAPVTGRPLGGS